MKTQLRNRAPGGVNASPPRQATWSRLERSARDTAWELVSAISRSPESIPARRAAVRALMAMASRSESALQLVTAICEIAAGDIDLDSAMRATLVCGVLENPELAMIVGRQLECILRKGADPPAEQTDASARKGVRSSGHGDTS